ncbi:AAA family ATPase [Aliarcobacter butzleri]
MELVYLWVEEYKNIKNQGFNFSPRFECEFFPKYDKDGKLKDDCEVEIIPKDYVSIFPNNINITAIVGENGTGKTNLLKLILQNNIKPFSNKLFFIIFYEKMKGFKLFTFNKQVLIKKNNLTKNHIMDIHENPNSIFPLIKIFFSNNLEIDMKNKVTLKNLSTLSLLEKKINNLKYELLNSISIEKHKKSSNSFDYENVSFEKQYFLIKSDDIELAINYIKNTNLKLPFNLNYINIEIKGNRKLTETKFIKNRFNELVVEKEFYQVFFSNNLRGLDAIKREIICNFLDYNLYEIKYYNNALFTMFIKKVEEKLYDKSIKNISLLYNEFDKIFNIIDHKEIQPLKKFLDYFTNAKEFLKICEEIFKNKTLSISYPIDKIPTNFIKLYKEFTKYENKFLIFSFENLLSSGQQSFLENFIRTYNFLVEDNYHNKNTNNILFCIDEGETSFHPNWQKKYIYNLIKFLSENFKEKEIHIIITSHSPFILSDIPKENVIFLEKYKEDDDEVKKDIQKIGNCKNAIKNIELKTFGANIHTLLSNGFFMSDGLMGEFAKSKIEEIKEFYELVKKCEKVINESEKTKNTIKNIYQGYEPNFRNIQKIIGEPFLQTIIKNYLDELEILFNGKKEFLDKEIKRLEELRKELK